MKKPHHSDKTHSQSPLEKRYESFSHPSDIGISVFGNTLEQLYENAGYALFDSLCNLEKVKETDKVEVSAVGDDGEGLLVNFLNELLYFQSVKGWLFRRFEVQELSNKTIQVMAWGECYQAGIHELFHEIKCATYHSLKIRQEKGRWRVDVVFDV